MIKITPTSNRTKPDRRGGMLVLICVMLVGILSLGGFAIGLAQIQLARIETQIVADCASISGAYLIGETHLGDLNTPQLMAQGMPSRNTILGRPANVRNSDVVLGRSSVNASGRQLFRPDSSAANSVRVTMRLDDGAAMEKPKLLFPFMLGIDSFGLERTSISVKAAHDVVLVVDRSGSMNRDLSGRTTPFNRSLQRTADFPHPTLSRWGIMVNSLDSLFAGFAANKIEEQFSLVTFGSDISGTFLGQFLVYRASDIDVTLTTDSRRIRNVLRDMWNNRPMIGATRIDAGIDAGVIALGQSGSRDFAQKTIILLTDGEQFPYSTAHIEAARRAAARGITIHAVAFSTGASFADVELIANIGGGKSFLAPDGPALSRAFEEISRMSPVLLIE